MASASHRPDLDALRGIATLAVVGYHAELGAMRGGFVGVDVFFVLSGFLVVTSLARAPLPPRWVASFYARRARRILPALLILLAILSAAALLLLPPSELVRFGQSLAAACGGVANIVLWRQSGYFAVTAQAQPLLHLWSLAIEEQLYLVVPLLLLVRDHRWRRRACMVALVLSLVAAEVGLQRLEGAIFYLGPFRAWELLLGAALALTTLPSVRGARAELIAVGGVAALLAPIALYDATTEFPGVSALVPCVGAAMLIWCGPHAALLRALAATPLRLVGKISYSLYLWHWPLIVFWRLAQGPDCSLVVPVVASFPVAIVSWWLVEERLREHSRAMVLAAGSAVLAAVGAAFILTDGLPARVSPAVRLLDAGHDDASPVRATCHGDDGTPIPWQRACVHGATGAPPDVVVWGDSFAAEVAVAVGDQLATTGRALRGLSHSSCPPVLGADELIRAACAAHNRDVLASITADPGSATVILVAHHRHYGLEVGSSAYVEGLRATLRALRTSGRHVILVGAVPTPGFDVPTRLAHDALRQTARRDPSSEPTFSLERTALHQGLAEVARAEGATLIDPADALCANGACRLLDGGRPLYFDDKHLSLTGARVVAPHLAAAAPPREQSR